MSLHDAVFVMLPRQRQTGGVTKPGQAATCGHANEGAKQGRTACSLPLLAASHKKPLDCICCIDRQTKQIFLKQAVVGGEGVRRTIRVATTSRDFTEDTGTWSCLL